MGGVLGASANPWSDQHSCTAAPREVQLALSSPWRSGPAMRRHRPRDPALTSRLMKRVRPTGSRAERVLRQALSALSLRYRLHVRGLPGTPDICFPRHRIAVFVDGDFWHGRILHDRGRRAFLASLRSKNRTFWIKKITSNVDRDARQAAELRRQGWLVLRIWETDALRDPTRAASRVARCVSRRACE